MKKELFVLGAAAFLALVTMFASSKGTTGAVGIACPEGFEYIAPYCVEKECHQVKCVKDYSFIRRPDCVCEAVYGKFMCEMKGSETTAVKSPVCTRRGNLNKICGSYDSNLRECVENPHLLSEN